VGDLSGGFPCRCNIANDDLSVGFDAGKNGGDSQGGVQNFAADLLADLRKGGNPSVLPRFYRHDPRCCPVCRLQLLHV